MISPFLILGVKKFADFQSIVIYDWYSIDEFMDLGGGLVFLSFDYISEGLNFDVQRIFICKMTFRMIGIQ